MPTRTCLASLLVLLVLVVGCGTSSGPPPRGACTGDAQCAADQTCEEGTCRPCATCVDAGTEPADAGGLPDAGADAGEQPDAGFDGGFEEDAGTDAGFDAGCVFDAGTPPNLLENPGFECGAPPEGWVPGPGADVVEESSDVHSGDRAARVTATGTASPTLFPAVSPVEENAAVETYCASAWVKGSAEGTARLSILRISLGGGLNEDTFSQPLTTSWERIRTSAQTTAFDDEITVRIRGLVDAGTALLVDDVDLWMSADGSCMER